jgi:acyl-[acyl carrier protein]--UDP-N-acetylglucosamine O-acyltransferase
MGKLIGIENLTKEKKMLLQTTDLLAIIIALGSSCTVMVYSIVAHRRLLKENLMLKRELLKKFKEA